MQTTLEINEALWQAALVKRNADEQARVTQVNEQAQQRHAALMSHTPEKLRTDFVPATFIALTMDQFVASKVSDFEAEIIRTQIAELLAIIAKQDPDTIKKFVDTLYPNT